MISDLHSLSLCMHLLMIAITYMLFSPMSCEDYASTLLSKSLLSNGLLSSLFCPMALLF